MLEQIIPHKSRFLLSWIKFFFLFITSAYLYSSSWAEETLNKLSLKEKIAQLVMVQVYTQDEKENVENVLSLIENYRIGGIIFMQGTIENQRQAYKKLQEKSKLPLLTSQDNEWGLSMRLYDGLRFPRNIMLGALQNENLIYLMGKEVGNQCRQVGVHINFAPVIDINSNPNNPVINDRSFGENAQDVTRKGLLFMKGLQDGGVLSCAKHFPGHGDTALDSHFSLPVINKSIEDLQNLEWKPFYKLIDEKVDCIMSAHLHLPLISGMPTTLCYKSTSNLLQDKLHFTGLVFTDSLQMKAITDHYAPGDSEVAALSAGNDILLSPHDVKASIEAIYKAVQKNEIPEDVLNKHVIKILKVKEKLNLHKSCALTKSFSISKEAVDLKERLFKEAITLASLNEKALPINTRKKTAFVQIGRDVMMKDALELVYTPYEEQYPHEIPPFFEELKKSIQADYFFIPKASDEKFISQIVKKLKIYNQIIVGVYEMNKYSKKAFGLTPSTLSFFDQIDDSKVAVSIFGSPYSLKYFKDQNVILMGYENDYDAQIGCAEILLGKRRAIGKLPISTLN